MKAYILVDRMNIVRCVATEENNLHKDKFHMDKYHVEMQGVVGDEYISESDTWVAMPGNYPQPTKAEVDEKKIQTEIVSTQRKAAIQSLKDKGELPVDY